MDTYLTTQAPSVIPAQNDKFGWAGSGASGLIVPPLNTDIRFSKELDLHHLSDEERPFTPTMTVGASTPLVDMDGSGAFGESSPSLSVTFGYNPRDYQHSAEKHPRAFHMHHEIPERFSWCEEDAADNKLVRIKKSLISKPKAQYACGSCFAICMAQVFSDCLVVAGAVGWAPNISETWLLANLPARVQSGCGGGNPAVIAPLLEKHGALDSSCVDYSWCENDKTLCASVSSTQHFDVKSLTARLNERIPKNGCWFPQKRFLYKLSRGSDVFFINPEAPMDVFRKTVKTHLLDFGPCVGGYVVLANFMSGAHTNPRLPTRGIYFEKCDYDGWMGGVSWNATYKAAGLHAVAIVGWGVERDVEYAAGRRGAVPYWHCRNSWGQSWGYQSGMFKMAMYPFNKYSQFDKEVMTSIGGPVGSMVLMRATEPPTIVDAAQVESRYRDMKRSLSDSYYKASPEAVVLFNRQHLLSHESVPADDVKPPEDDAAYDVVPASATTKQLIVLGGAVLLVAALLYLKS